MNNGQQFTQVMFDATGVSPEMTGGGFFPVSPPNGWLCQIVGDNGYKPMKSGDGNFLEIELIGLEGEVNGVPALLRLNLQHTDPSVAQRAGAEMSAIGHCVGVLRIQSIGDIAFKPFRIVSVEQAQSAADKAAGKAPFTNVARNGYRDINGNKPVAGQAFNGQGGGGAPANPNQQGGQPPQGGNMQNNANTGAPANQGGGAPQNGQGGGWQGGQGGGQPQGDPNAGNWNGGGQNGNAPQNGNAGGWGGAPANQQGNGNGNGGGAPGWAGANGGQQ